MINRKHISRKEKKEMYEQLKDYVGEEKANELREQYRRRKK